MPRKRTSSNEKHPVSPDSVADYFGGVKRPGVTTGRADPLRARIARKATSSMPGMSRTAGMMMDNIQSTSPYISGFRLDAYRTSYANGLDSRSGTYDVPTYFVQMNEQNGGLIYWPVTLQEKYSWYRYWTRTDAYIGRAMELMADLPMSKLTLNMPKIPGKDKAFRQEILDFFHWQVERLDLFDLCLHILWEMNMIGNVYIFHEWDEKYKMWSRAVLLPPEEVYIFQYPFSDNCRVEYKPERLLGLIKRSVDNNGTPNGDVWVGAAQSGTCNRGDLDQKILDNIPKEIVDMVRREGCIVMDSDPYTGSFVHHVSRRKSKYQDLGASALERVLVPMLQKEHFRYTQLSLASRNMTPKNLITAPGLMPEELDELRTQVDMSYMDPEYTVITNYEVNWQQIGAESRLLDLQREYEVIENQVFAALGVTRELLTGEGMYSGSKITVEILNSMFMLVREVLKGYIEKKLFRPVAEAHGWYEQKANGVKKYWYPEISFNRLTIRDNQEVFESLFQLYQKGSLPVDVLYELFNLNAERMTEQLKKDVLTVKDATFNRMLEEINAEVGRSMVERSDVVKRVIKYLGLSEAEKPEEGGDAGASGFGGFGGMGDEGGEPEGGAPAEQEEQGGEPGSEQDEEGAQAPSDDVDETQEDTGGKSDNTDGGDAIEQFAEEVATELPPDATDEQIKDAIRKKAE